MNIRQQNILFAVIQNYIETGVPVSSAIIASKYLQSVSTATIRAELAWLEENGFLHQPHTSAGRVPTDQGYRLYVNELQHSYQLSPVEQQLIKQGIHQHNTLVDILQNTVKVLAGCLECISLITAPKTVDVYSSGTAQLIDHPEFDSVAKIRNILQILEDKQQLLENVQQELFNKPIVIKIGDEIDQPELADCSIIAIKYNIAHEPAGIVSCITSKRIYYDKAQSTMNHVAQQLENSVDNLMANVQ